MLFLVYGEWRSHKPLATLPEAVKIAPPLCEPADLIASTQKLASIFLSLVILLIGHGLQQTLLPLVAQSLQWSSAAIGSTGAAYFCGFIIGCFYIPLWIHRVGH